MRPSIKQSVNDNGGGIMDFELQCPMVIFFKFLKMDKSIKKLSQSFVDVCVNMKISIAYS